MASIRYRAIGGEKKIARTRNRVVRCRCCPPEICYVNLNSAGGDEGFDETYSGFNSEPVVLSYVFDAIIVKDALEIYLNGSMVANTGCISGERRGAFIVPRGQYSIRVKVIPLCAGTTSGTRWGLNMGCAEESICGLRLITKNGDFGYNKTFRVEVPDGFNLNVSAYFNAFDIIPDRLIINRGSSVFVDTGCQLGESSHQFTLEGKCRRPNRDPGSTTHFVRVIVLTSNRSGCSQERGAKWYLETECELSPIPCGSESSGDGIGLSLL